MKTKRASTASSKPLRKGSRSKKTTPLGESIVRGLEEGLAHLRGEIKLRTRVIHVPEDVDGAPCAKSPDYRSPNSRNGTASTHARFRIGNKVEPSPIAPSELT
jgi:hypothetical protein